MSNRRIGPVAALSLVIVALFGSGLVGETATTGPEPAVAEQVAVLVKALQAEEPAQRQQAAEKLVEFGQAARAILEQILEEDGDLSPVQQSRIRDVLIDGGEIIRLEKASKLDDEQIETLQTLRTEQIKRQDSYRAGEELKKAVEEEEMSDEALAVLVYSLVRQIAKDDQRDRGFESYSLSNIFKAVLARPQAGPATGKAFGYWIRAHIIPRTFPKGEAAGSPRPFDWESTRIVKQLVSQDKLDEATFDELLSAMCRQAGQSDRVHYGGNELGLNTQTVLPMCYSRHCRAEHIGRLIQAIIAENFNQEGLGGWSPSRDSLGYVIGSPLLNEGHARAILQWLLPSMGRLDGMQIHQFDALTRLTGESFVKPEDFTRVYTGYFDNEAPVEPTFKRIQDRVRAWWEAHGDKPVLSEPPPPKFRYVQAEISLESESEPKLRITTDLALRPGIGQLIRDSADSSSYLYVCQLASPGMMGSWMRNREQLVPNGVGVMEYQGSENATSMGSKVFIPGEPQFTSQSTSQRGDKQVRVFRAAMLLPLDDAAVTREQLDSLAFWAERMVRAAADQMVRAATLGPNELSMWNEAGIIRWSPLNLEPYRLPGLEREVRKLLDHPEPMVVGTAGLLLSRWGADFDAAKVRLLLKSEKHALADMAGEALAVSGDSEGISFLIERMNDPLRAATAARVLAKSAASPKLDAAARKRWAAELIRRLLPTADEVSQPCTLQVLVIKAWTDEDYGYEPGAAPDSNNTALKRYHDWATN